MDQIIFEHSEKQYFLLSRSSIFVYPNEFYIETMYDLALFDNTRILFAKLNSFIAIQVSLFV